MVAKRKSGEADSTIYFSQQDGTGVLIQFRFKRAIYFVNGEKIDEFNWHDGTPASIVDTWVNAKRNANKEEAKSTSPQ